jgi:putative addiction module component (TIGR02574 family)
MSPAANQLLTAALALPGVERAELAARLLESTDEAGFATPEIAAAWEAEVAGRIRDSDAGRAQSISAEEVHRKLREKYGFFNDSLPSSGS